MKVELNDAGLMVRVDLGVIYHDAGSLLAAIFSGGEPAGSTVVAIEIYKRGRGAARCMGLLAYTRLYFMNILR